MNAHAPNEYMTWCTCEMSTDHTASNMEGDRGVAGDSLGVWGQQHAGGVVEENAHTLVWELEAKAVLVGVINPLGHPQGLGLAAWGRVCALLHCHTHKQQHRLKQIGGETET